MIGNCALSAMYGLSPTEDITLNYRAQQLKGRQRAPFNPGSNYLNAPHAYLTSPRSKPRAWRNGRGPAVSQSLAFSDRSAGRFCAAA